MHFLGPHWCFRGTEHVHTVCILSSCFTASCFSVFIFTTVLAQVYTICRQTVKPTGTHSPKYESKGGSHNKHTLYFVRLHFTPSSRPYFCGRIIKIIRFNESMHLQTCAPHTQKKEQINNFRPDEMTVLTNTNVVVNPRRACAARVTVLGLCVCVCVCPRLYSRTTGNDAAYERY